MSDEVTERDMEALAEALDDLVMSKGVVLDDTRLDWLTDWIAERIAQARREGAAEAWDEGAEAVRQYDYHQPPVQNPYRAALRGDA